MYTPTRILIWGKTYPELSMKYKETVCTGGVREDGSPIRLYPVPLRYQQGEQQYALYQWITVPIRKSRSDPRPESFKVDPAHIVCGDLIPTSGTWDARRDLIFRSAAWHFDSMDVLKDAQSQVGRSMGVMRIGSIEGIDLLERPVEDRAKYEEKQKVIAELVASDMFHPEYRELEYLPYEIRMAWRCAMLCRTCRKQPHGMKVLDWGLLELARREGWTQAVAKLASISNLATHDFRLFLGTFRLHPKNFGVIGLWYPKLRAQRSLFDAMSQ
jgi:hypothetical protein